MKFFGRWIAIAAFAATIFGQAPAPTLTDPIYWAAQDAQVKALCSITNPVARESKAATLDTAGFLIDRQIDLWCLDPTLVMGSRAQLGFSWVPNAFQPNLVDPLNLLGGVHTDMTKPWARSVKVSVLAKDYPALAPPAPPPTPSVNPVAFDYGNGTYAANTTAVSSQGKWLYKEGDPITYNGKTLYFHMGSNIMGASPMWLDKPFSQ
jgi:hypothetical protein